MVSNPQKPSQCHPNGEVAGLKDVFVIDAASFPSVPASTVALLTMANAYRIAKTSIHSKVQPSCL
jgi:choline dehydrogenase-like flavoprotein